MAELGTAARRWPRNDDARWGGCVEYEAKWDERKEE